MGNKPVGGGWGSLWQVLVAAGPTVACSPGCGQAMATLDKGWLWGQQGTSAFPEGHRPRSLK